MGVVYLATSPSGRRAAVKVIRDSYVADEQFRVRFAREVAAARCQRCVHRSGHRRRDQR
jgi:serine/threonine protein kinase